jgi:hypothetical protein
VVVVVEKVVAAVDGEQALVAAMADEHPVVFADVVFALRVAALVPALDFVLVFPFAAVVYVQALADFVPVVFEAQAALFCPLALLFSEAQAVLFCPSVFHAVDPEV